MKQAKKPVKYLKCPRCKGSNFHYEGGGTNTPSGHPYRCVDCGFVRKD